MMNKSVNKKFWIITIICIAFANTGNAQMKRKRAQTGGAVEETFWAPNLIGMGTVKTVGGGNLNVTIMHNFGIATDEPLKNFFGIDLGPNVRLGIDYGITDHWSIGIGRTTFEKVVDMRTKIAVLRQQKDGSIPLSIAVKADAGLITLENNRPIKDDLNYLLSLPIARKFGDRLSLQLAPMYAHFNAVTQRAPEHNLFALGAGMEIQLSRRFALMGEYYPVLGDRNPGTNNAFALGLNIETGGHVFQVYFASSQWHTEQQVIALNEEQFWAGDFRFGFNINRLFTL